MKILPVESSKSVNNVPQISSRQLYKVAKLLIQHGKSIGYLLPWHSSKTPFHWLVAELLLRRTTRSAVSKTFVEFVRKFSDWTDLQKASEQEIVDVISWIGLGNQRSKQLKTLACTICKQHGGRVPASRESLLKLPGVGPYIADALLLYVFGRKVFPIDPNVQRVFRRAMGLPVAKGTRHTDPYADEWLKQVVNMILKRYRHSELVNMHRGILDIAWTTCRQPKNCSICKLGELCNDNHSKEA